MMTHEKKDQLHVMAWLLVFVGLAMSIPGMLVFGAVGYICGYLMFSGVLLLVLRLGRTSIAARYSYSEDFNQWC
jgi:hypothetical protein